MMHLVGFGLYPVHMQRIAVMHFLSSFEALIGNLLRSCNRRSRQDTSTSFLDNRSGNETECRTIFRLVNHRNTDRGVTMIKGETLGFFQSPGAMRTRRYPFRCMYPIKVQTEEIARPIFLIEQQPVPALGTVDIIERRCAATSAH